MTDPVPVVLGGAALWLVVLAATGARPLDAWFGACVVGVGLAALGLGVLALQRRAHRRGDKRAQKL